jgi:uncharacterized protein YnzC (UPF0291/DUF896 family)
MLTPDKMQRISELSHKKKAGTLTEAEATEQQALREEYLTAFRSGFRRQLDNIEFVDEEGNVYEENPFKNVKPQQRNKPH